MKYQHEDIKSRICGKMAWFYQCSKCGFPKELLVKKGWYVQPRFEATYILQSRKENAQNLIPTKKKEMPNTMYIKQVRVE